MGKTKKKKSVIKKPIQIPLIQIPLRNPISNPIMNPIRNPIRNPIYYPMPQYYQLKTKKMRKKDFIYTIGNSFKPREFMETPKKKINFSKTDNINKFVGNVLDLYNIDHNPEFLNFSINNFHNKITSYINILNNDHYLESINNVKNNSTSSMKNSCESDGILFTGCKDILIKKYNILNIYSKQGVASDLMYKNENINIQA